MPVYQLGEHRPEIAPEAWVAPDAVIVGKVRLLPGASVWYGAVLRGDNEWITVGERSSVQEGCVLHTDMGFPLVIGSECTVGHQAMLHGCTLDDGVLVGIQAVVLNGVRLGTGCLVGAGAIVTEGKVFEPGQLILGAPAKAVRPVSDEQRARMRLGALHYVDNATRHRTQLRRIDG